MTFLPDVNQARMLTENIRRKLDGSLMALAQACRGVARFDEDALGRWLSVLRDVPAIPPAVYVLYHDCLSAVRRDDPDRLAALLQQVQAIPLGSPSFRYVILATARCRLRRGTITIVH